MTTLIEFDTIMRANDYKYTYAVFSWLELASIDTKSAKEATNNTDYWLHQAELDKQDALQTAEHEHTYGPMLTEQQLAYMSSAQINSAHQMADTWTEIIQRVRRVSAETHPP
ncbi:hypothetical protein FC50_GL000027 [Lacticaseibacillus pantheris DSM 15945 = JCM 12539 = NBRC 106106]|uniref:Uncharacterized protein n=1 Tax=Lacticaseibacillus pantheris DSM 15945 = JCM 12539 = NBRC 106106 TaxID=1423783 RepID=A0A0R1U0P3_9LACO|nr:hypothetical protein [Lacticaseibacillus pantheris]KRL87056.1 hypothetical protein FC50_GL000027 [Lacticaseibacillus pantheris DSM 15945 = JCM 12539 = NBRC 106106]